MDLKDKEIEPRKKESEGNTIKYPKILMPKKNLKLNNTNLINAFIHNTYPPPSGNCQLTNQRVQRQMTGSTQDRSI